MSRSLQFRLSLWLSLTIVLVAVAADFLSFSSAFNEAIELQDDQLRQTAAWLQRQHFSTPRSRSRDRHRRIRSLA